MEESFPTSTGKATPIVTAADVGGLLLLFAKTPYDSRETLIKTQQVLNKCLELMQVDYKCLVVPNTSGELCSSYPNQIIIPEKQKTSSSSSSSSAASCSTSSSLQPPSSFPYPSPLLPTSPSFSSVVSRGVRGGGGGGGGGRCQQATPATTSTTTPTTTAAATTNNVHSSSTNGSNSNSSSGSGNGWEGHTDANKLREMILKAKFARCRARFPVPVILYKQNYICRSSTLAGGPEMYGRSGIEYLLTAATSSRNEEEELQQQQQQQQRQQQQQEEEGSSEWQLFDRVRSQDIRLLKSCNVGVIIDLMVEKKKVKYGLNVTSSEKVDKENRYSEFSILSLPYPGCEFFKEFRDSGYTADGLSFNWNHTFMDATLVIPEKNMSRKVCTDWNLYRKWDLVRLTQNYLRLLLIYAEEGDSGLLVHCISGWDRTPLFISLLRLSLWADGLIHSSLSPVEILYLTIAYDWLLFGHDLKDRLSKGEEIFFFCFDFLKYITSEEFALGKRRHTSSESSSGGGDKGGTSGLLLLLDGEGLSPAESFTSLTSSCSSCRSAPLLPPTYFRAEGSGHSGSNIGSNTGSCLAWPYGSDNSDLDLDDLSPRQSPPTLHSSRCTGDSEVTKLDRDLPRASTSPVAVPVPRNLRNRSSSRKREESVSSVGSWQIITHTGSLRDSPAASSTCSSTTAPPPAPAAAPPSVSVCMSLHSASHPKSPSLSSEGDLVHSCCTVRHISSSSDSRDSVGSHRESTTRPREGCGLLSQPSRRLQKLAQVRSVFYSQYVTSIGFSSCNGRQDTGLGSLVSNIAQKVGIRPNTNRST